MKGPFFKEKLMKDMLQFGAVMVIGFGLFAAVPVLGIVAGVGLGIWFLWCAIMEDMNG